MRICDIRFASPKIPRHQGVLFTQHLDEIVAPDAPVRQLVALLDDRDWTPWERAYTGYGQPPIHPRYMAGAILYGLLLDIRSSRKLEDAGKNRIDFIWLLEGLTPDHSTFAQFRQRHRAGIEALKKEIARELVMRRENALLQLLEDGTRLRADSDRHGARTAQTIERVIAALDERLKQLERNDARDDAPVQTDAFADPAPEAEPAQDPAPEAEPAQDPAQVANEIARLEKQLAQYQRALEAAQARDARAQAHGGQNAKAVRVPITDPESHILPNKEGGFAPNYTPVAAIEPETGAVLYADVLEGSDEASAVMPAVEAAEELAGQKVDAVLADGNFATGPVLEKLDEHGTEAYMPTSATRSDDNPAIRPDPTQPVAEAGRKKLPKRGKYFSRNAFIYDPEADQYYCPMGNPLAPYKTGKNKNGADCTYYRAEACAGCPVAADCVNAKKTPFRTLVRDEYEPLREATAQRMATPEGRAIYRIRAPGIEGMFGVIKAILGIRRFQTRGLQNVRTEWDWITTAYNLKKLLALQARSASTNPKNLLEPSIYVPQQHFSPFHAITSAPGVHKTHDHRRRPRLFTGIRQYVQIPAAA